MTDQPFGFGTGSGGEGGSGSGGGGPQFPFGGLSGDLAGKIPLFAELEKLLSWRGGPGNWGLARAGALAAAPEGEPAGGPGRRAPSAPGGPAGGGGGRRGGGPPPGGRPPP